MSIKPNVSYSKLVDEKFARVWDQFASTQKALDKADADMTAYKLTANEFRGALMDQAQTFVTKGALDAAKADVEIQRQRVDKVETTAANLAGKLWMLAAIVAVFQLIINIAQHSLLKP